MFLVDHGTWKHKKHKEFVTGTQELAIVYKHKFHAFWSSPFAGAPMCLDQLASASKIYCVIFLSSFSLLSDAGNLPLACSLPAVSGAVLPF